MRRAFARVGAARRLVASRLFQLAKINGRLKELRPLSQSRLLSGPNNASFPLVARTFVIGYFSPRFPPSQVGRFVPFLRESARSYLCLRKLSDLNSAGGYSDECQRLPRFALSRLGRRNIASAFGLSVSPHRGRGGAQGSIYVPHAL